MARLQGQTIAASYDQVLAVNQNGGLSATASVVEDGSGTNSPMYLSTSKIGIGSESFSGAKAGAPDALLHLYTESLTGNSFFKMEAKDSGDTIAPELDLYRNSTDPDDGDSLGGIRFSGNDDAGNYTQYATIYAEAVDVTNSGTTEDGELRLQILVAGNDVDVLSVKSAGSTALTSIVNDLQMTTDDGKIQWGTAGTTYIQGNTSGSDYIRFYIDGALAFNVSVDGDVGIGNVANPSNNQLYVKQETDSHYTIKAENTDADNPLGIDIDFSASSNLGDGSDDHFIKCQDSDGEHFAVYGDGDVVNADNSYGSDVRIKDDITDATSKLAELNQLKVRNFVIKKNDGTKSSYKKIGFVADELETVFPSIVKKRKLKLYGHEYDDMKTITYTPLIAILTKAVQELSAKVTALESA